MKILWVKIKSFSAFSVFSGFPMVKCKLKSLQMRCMIYSFPISSAAEVSEPLGGDSAETVRRQ